MPLLRWLWLAIPVLGLGELGAHFYFARRAPDLDEWRALRPRIVELRKKDELVVVAPAWAEPLARHAFGEDQMPLAHVARPDVSGFARALEVSALGKQSPELDGWREIERHEAGRFTLRVLENPRFTPLRFDFVEAVARGRARVSVSGARGEEPCPFTENARTATGGLLGHVAYPRARFRCGGDDSFVGVTVIEDDDYRPHRCILARLSRPGTIAIRFPDVPLGSRVRGFTGLSFFLLRDGGTPSAPLGVHIDGREIGRLNGRELPLWAPFEFSTAGATEAGVEFRVEIDAVARELCLFADSR